MTHLPCSLRYRKPPRQNPGWLNLSDSGFSLVEILMGVIILTVALGMAGAMNGVATRGLRNSTLLNDRNAAVDADIAMIRALAGRYTWCSGKPDIQPSDVPTCVGDTPSDESYFSPAVTQQEAIDFPAEGNQSMVNFERACQAGTLSDDLVNRINTRPVPAGLNRNASVISVGGVQTHRIEILYQTPANDESPFSRSLVITPPVASFCP